MNGRALWALIFLWFSVNNSSNVFSALCGARTIKFDRLWNHVENCAVCDTNWKRNCVSDLCLTNSAYKNTRGWNVMKMWISGDPNPWHGEMELLTNNVNAVLHLRLVALHTAKYQSSIYNVILTNWIRNTRSYNLLVWVLTRPDYVRECWY